MADRLHSVSGAGLEQAIFRRMTAVDRLSELYTYDVELLSDKKDISPYEVIGKSLSIGVKTKSGDTRYFSGIISSFVDAGPKGNLELYQVQLCPWLWLLTHSQDCCIFQGLSVIGIVEKIFKDKYGFTDFDFQLESEYSQREYCVQYRESDFAFISRLLEDEGIYYYFNHDAAKHILVLCDATPKHAKIGADGELVFRPPNEVSAGGEHVFQWQHRVAVQPGQLVLRDFDYEKPKANLEVRQNNDRGHPHATLEKYDYPGSYKLADDGNRLLKIMTDEYDAKFAVLNGRARSYRLSIGKRFRLADHPRKTENGDYLVVATTTEVTSGEIEQFSSDAQNRFEVQFVSIPEKMTFRPPRQTAKPIIAGPQTAIVVGKKTEEIWTDSMGRVKVQFHWDRVGEHDESSSCWIRVAQIWAGKAWGAIHIPRIGQEVIVEFLEGDPDKPIITGRVYNGEQVVPYSLPDMASQSGIKSRSTKSGDQETFNELRFEDKKGAECIYFHAERDFERVVENNDILKVGLLTKDKGNQTIEIFNDQTLKIGGSESSSGSQTLEIWKDQTETLHTGNRKTTLEKGNDTLTISAGNQKIDIPAGQCEFTAGKKITLTVGASSIVIEPAKIVIKSPQIEIKADMKAELSGAVTDVKGTATLKVEGGIVKIN